MILESLLLSNRRVIKESGGYLFALLLDQIDSIQVLNQHRNSNMDMTSTGIRSGNLRTGSYHGQSRSKAIGDILFMSTDHQDIAFNNIQDPKGLADMIKAAQRMLEEKDEVEK